MKLTEIQQEFALNISHLIAYIFASGYKCTLGEALRTREQACLYADQHKGIRNSLHCKKLAMDINVFSPSGEYLKDTDEYQVFGRYWESLNPRNRWGGHFQHADGNHFETQEDL